jgi:hypothetical protein
MNSKIALCLLGCLGMLCLAALSQGEDKLSKENNQVDKPANSSPSADGQQVAKLIDQLNDERFAKREQATEELTKLGQKSIPALGDAAADERPEVSERAFKILGTILEKGDATSQEAAKAKLGELAKSDNAGVAKEAKKILDRPTESPEDARRLARPGIIFPGGPFPGGGGPRIEIAPGAIGGGIRIDGGGVRRMTIRATGGGDKEIEVTEGDRTVKITENATDGIRVESTETKDGKSITKEYKAANEKELKEKHPEGHKLYKEYSGGGAILGGEGPDGIRLEFRGSSAIDGELPKELRERIEGELKRVLPDGAVPFGVPDALPGSDIEEEFKKAEAELRKALEGVALPGGDVPPEFRKMIEDMEKRFGARAKGAGDEEDRADEPAPGDAPTADDAPAADAPADLDAAIEQLRKSLKDSKDEKKLLEAIKRLEKLQAEQIERLKAKQDEIRRQLKEAE